MRCTLCKLPPIIIAVTLVAILSANANAHTRFEISSADEGTRVYSNIVISHGC